MIGYLKGQVLHLSDKKATLLCASGIGYEISYAQNLSIGDEISVFISHIIREAHQELYSFESSSEKDIFEMLLSVKGVGPKSAYSLVYAVGVESLISAIQFEQKKIITQAPGIGAKAASQIILDLKDKFSSVEFMQKFKAHTSHIASKSNGVEGGSVLRDALMACSELGFSEKKVLPVAQKILEKQSFDKAEDLISVILKEL